MSFHLVVGAGAVGSRTALLLARAGERVRLVSRGGRAVDHPGVEAIAADAADRAGMVDLARGARAVHNCAMPRYDRWPEDFPPISEALLDAAEAAGAAYVLVGNTYAYGPGPGILTEDLPLAPSTRKGRVRAAMWEAALRRPIRVAEVRGSDYLGRDAASLFTLLAVPRILAGHPAAVPAELDVAHAWSYTGDVARTAVAIALGDHAWGRAWHVPSSTATVRELAGMLAAAAGLPPPVLTRMPDHELTGDPILNEVIEMAYLFATPQVLDAGAAERQLGLVATPIADVLAEMVLAA